MAQPRTEERPRDVAAVYAAHAQFVWASLQRLGVPDPDLDDQLQEVFVIVHRRLPEYEPNAPLRAWLFGICKHVATARRRRAHARREAATPGIPERSSEGVDLNPEEALSAAEAGEKLEALLDEIDPVKRAVLVMFEIDEMSCDDIATELGVPIGTVYSRLYAARKAFQRALERRNAREGTQ